MTLQDLITAVSTNLGNRASGQIGNQSVDTVVIAAINSAFVECVKAADPDYYNREAQLTLASPDRVYTLPTVDIDSNDIRIKDIIWHRSSYSDSGSNIAMCRVPQGEFIKSTYDWDQEHTGIPSVFAVRGGKVYINKIPTSSVLLTLYVETFPQTLTVSDLNLSLPIGPEWSLALEAYATHFCYIKLQQIQLADYWYGVFQKQKSDNSAMNRKSEGRVQQQDYGIYHGNGKPWNDPYVKEFN